jgi:hypothetical protein
MRWGGRCVGTIKDGGEECQFNPDEGCACVGGGGGIADVGG